jgi:hypothetical protein
MKQFRLDTCNPAKTPIAKGIKLSNDMGEDIVDSTMYKQMVGKLIYLTNTRPNILFDVGIISHYMSKPQVSHLNVVKHIFRYFRRTTSYGIFY